MIVYAESSLIPALGQRWGIIDSYRFLVLIVTCLGL